MQEDIHIAKLLHHYFLLRMQKYDIFGLPAAIWIHLQNKKEVI